MIRLGILDFDISHVIEFTQRLNHVGIDESQWVDGARVVIACPGDSTIMPERIPGYTKEIAQLGVPLVDRPEDLLGHVDGMLITSQQGAVHWERARPFLEAGISCFIDKPFTCSVADARQLVDLAARQKTPVFSSSALRYAPELVQFAADVTHGAIQGAVTYGPAPLHAGNPGLFHYGIHAVEILYTLMGPGCERVVCTHHADTDVVTGQWRDGRLGTMRGIRKGQSPYGFVAFTDTGAQSVSIGSTFFYRELLKKIVAMFQTRQSPLDPAESVEIVAFIEAALRSANHQSACEEVRP